MSSRDGSRLRRSGLLVIIIKRTCSTHRILDVTLWHRGGALVGQDPIERRASG
jgi:hypothetical protein